MRHPAKFTGRILDTIAEHWPPTTRGPILDPFAGTGRVHDLADRLGLPSIGVELEPEWAAEHPRTVVGDALNLPFPDGSFGAVVTSPCYGNRMADHHEARDASRRHTYRHSLGRPLSAGSAAGLQWGERYREFHERAWAEAARVLRPGGLFVLNVSDHIRGGERQPVAAWHAGVLEALGFVLVRRLTVRTPRQRHGANGRARVDGEQVYMFRDAGAGARLMGLESYYAQYEPDGMLRSESGCVPLPEKPRVSLPVSVPRRDESWKTLAACRGMDVNLFFPEQYEIGAPHREAQRVCASCTVREECLDYALIGREKHGIWGGVTELERRRLRRKRRTA